MLYLGPYDMNFCQEGTLNAEIERIICEVPDYIIKNLKVKPSAIILTGSFSRGEGSVYKHDGKLIVLGDIEFLIYFKHSANNLQQRLAELSNNYSKLLKNNNIECKIDFGFITDAFFSRIKPTIFAIELLESGKVLWGDKNLLKRFNHIRKEEIKIIDGFYLISNRMIELLKGLDYIFKEDILLEQAAYANIKMLLDIPTAILTVKSKFVTGYINRLNILIEECEYTEFQIFENKDDWNNLIKDIKFWTEYKIRPIPLKDIYKKKFPKWSDTPFKDQVLFFWLKLVPIVKIIWEWQIKSISSKERLHSNQRDLLFNLQSRKEIIRDWIKLFIKYAKFSSGVSIDWTYFLKASPRHLIYKSASELYFRCSYLLKEKGEVHIKEISEIEKYLPLKYMINKNEDLDLGMINSIINKVYHNWTFHIR